MGAPRQALLGEIDAQHNWNGLTIGVSYCCGFGANLLPALLDATLRRHASLAAATLTAAAAALLWVVSAAESLLLASALFVATYALFEFTRTAALAQIAVAMERARLRSFLAMLALNRTLVAAAQSAFQAIISAASACQGSHCLPDSARRRTAILAVILAAVPALIALSSAAGMLRQAAAARCCGRPRRTGTVDFDRGPGEGWC